MSHFNGDTYMILIYKNMKQKWCGEPHHFCEKEKCLNYEINFNA